MPRVAVLDDKGLLIGSKQKSKLAKGDVECGDLPCDGSHRLIDGAFWPVGRGRGKPRNPPVSPYQALAQLIRSVENGAPVPQECTAWADWYDEFGGKR
ncbi:hypothetical protein HOP60_09700 [Halomonas daqingensis]|uniref:Uncharacterized protein n=1 Tax=Billgrantia desiderata TaxID=52021 RepID=A0ABS9B4J3_9GAMM|nr:hypothetical protein [Halomonas desiderata]MCE8042426.1 hypothetical protein [Halomonas desiderata]MCE8047001.1 hypothetical protein [Halomonas desiderata]